MANIGPRERWRRMLTGVAALVIAVAGGAALVAIGVPRIWRLALVVPVWLGALGLAQARART